MSSKAVAQDISPTPTLPQVVVSTAKPGVTSQAGTPAVFEGDLRDLPSSDPLVPVKSPLKYIPGQEPKGSAPLYSNWVDPILQKDRWNPLLPESLFSFDGMSLSNGGSGWPPDTNGDVGFQHYVQVVNTSVAIFDKNTGERLWMRSFNDFFQGPAGTPCDTANRGDPIVLFDPFVSRWLVTDFAWFAGSGPFYECLAVSRGPNPLTDGWYFYALRADTETFSGFLNDYPKLGVWLDGWYMTANMFQQNPPYNGFGVRLWALDRTAMINGGDLRDIHFDICLGGSCDSLLPANLRGELPEIGSPEYFLSVSPNQLNLWTMKVDWNEPENSTLSGPVAIPVAPFSIAASIPQKGSSILLDSLSWRLMHPLQYRKVNGLESLWAVHTVNSSGIAALRWYQVNDPGESPSLEQQGTYQPDSYHRWMGSLAVDKDGNMSVGYSTASNSLYPEIRINGRLAGEMPGVLTQGETLLKAGSGGQTTYTRWGDYSTMAIDPVDDCTFWYTNEYFQVTGTGWQTRIGSFRYPSCDQPKGVLTGSALNSETNQPIAHVPMTAQSADQTVRVVTGIDGTFSMELPVEIYSLTAGPSLPGYPISVTVTDILIITNGITSQNITLQAVPYLTGESFQITGGMIPENEFPEPGESGLYLYRNIKNTGAAKASAISSTLSGFTEGVSIQEPHSPYPEILPGEMSLNSLPYKISLDHNIACGNDLFFMHEMITGSSIYTNTFKINASVPLSRQIKYENSVESGFAGWTITYPWDITSLRYRSPFHSWTDSPNGNYMNSQNVSLTSPVINLLGKRKVQISGWIMYDLETGYDYLLLEYSLNSGASWNTAALEAFTGIQPDWKFFEVEAGVFDNIENAAIRFRLVTDSSVVRDGIYLDDLALTYEPFVCRRIILFPILK